MIVESFQTSSNWILSNKIWFTQFHTTNCNDVIADSVAEEIKLFIRQIKEEYDVKSCRCCVKFPTKQLQYLEQDKLEDDYPDIHQIPKEIVEKLVWSCRWFPQNKKLQKGAFYYKRVPGKGNYIEGISSISGLLKVLGPTNPGYMRGKKIYPTK